MSVSITREERDALYDRILLRLNGIDTVYRAVQGEDWEVAQECGQEFSDLLRLVCEDLGWGDSADEKLTLSTPPDVLDRAALVLLGLARDDKAHHDADLQEAKESSDESGHLMATCQRVLRQLKG